MLYDKWADAVLRVHGRGGERVGRSELNRLVETAPRALEKLGDNLDSLPILYVEQTIEELAQRVLDVTTGPSNMVGFLLRRKDFDGHNMPHSRGHAVNGLRAKLAQHGLGLAQFGKGARYVRGFEVVCEEWGPIFYERGRPATISDKFQRMLAILMKREPGEVSIAECNAFMGSIVNPRKGFTPAGGQPSWFYIGGAEISFEEFADDFLLEAEEVDPLHRNFPIIHFLVEQNHAPHLRSYFKALIDELREHGMDVQFALDTEKTVKNGKSTLACQMVPILLEPVAILPMKAKAVVTPAPIQRKLFKQFIDTLTKEFEIPPGTYSAKELNAIVDLWPDPIAMCRHTESDAANFSIAFNEVSFEQIGRWLIQYGRGEIDLMPMFLLEEERMKDWQADVNVQTFLAYLESERLGARITYERDLFLCRGKWVRACDLRPIFLQGATIEAKDGSVMPRYSHGSGGGGGSAGVGSARGVKEEQKKTCLCSALGQIVCGASTIANCPRLRA